MTRRYICPVHMAPRPATDAYVGTARIEVFPTRDFVGSGQSQRPTDVTSQTLLPVSKQLEIIDRPFHHAIVTSFPNNTTEAMDMTWWFRIWSRWDEFPMTILVRRRPIRI